MIAGFIAAMGGQATFLANVGKTMAECLMAASVEVETNLIYRLIFENESSL